MRKFIIIIAIASMFAACGNADSKSNSKDSTFTPRVDTTKVDALWKIGNVKKSDSVYRIVTDVFKPVQFSTTTSKGEWIKDTVYYVPFITDTVSKKPKYYGLPAAFVQEITVQPLVIDSTKKK
jgi:ABC-type glycerol-3-phosphate transport system substrate-binding protein